MDKEEKVLKAVVRAKPDHSIVNRINLELERAGIPKALFWHAGVLDVGTISIPRHPETGEERVEPGRPKGG